MKFFKKNTRRTPLTAPKSSYEANPKINSDLLYLVFQDWGVRGKTWNLILVDRMQLSKFEKLDKNKNAVLDNLDSYGTILNFGNGTEPPAAIVQKIIELSEINELGNRISFLPIISANNSKVDALLIASCRENESDLRDALQALKGKGGVSFDKSKNADGMSPILLASSFGTANTVGLLLQEGFNILDQSNNGSCALHYAAISGNEETIRLLLSKTNAPHIDSKNDLGTTPLFIAAANGRIKAVELLIEKGADIEKVITYKNCSEFIDDKMIETMKALSEKKGKTTPELQAPTFSTSLPKVVEQKRGENEPLPVQKQNVEEEEEEEFRPSSTPIKSKGSALFQIKMLEFVAPLQAELDNLKKQLEASNQRELKRGELAKQKSKEEGEVAKRIALQEKAQAEIEANIKYQITDLKAQISKHFDSFAEQDEELARKLESLHKVVENLAVENDNIVEGIAVEAEKVILPEFTEQVAKQCQVSLEFITANLQVFEAMVRTHNTNEGAKTKLEAALFQNENDPTPREYYPEFVSLFHGLHATSSSIQKMVKNNKGGMLGGIKSLMKVAGKLDGSSMGGVDKIFSDSLKGGTEEQTRLIKKIAEVCPSPVQMDIIINSLALALLQEGRGSKRSDGKEGNNAADDIKKIFNAIISGEVTANLDPKITVVQLFKAVTGKDMAIDEDRPSTKPRTETQEREEVTRKIKGAKRLLPMTQLELDTVKTASFKFLNSIFIFVKIGVSMDEEDKAYLGNNLDQAIRHQVIINPEFGKLFTKEATVKDPNVISNQTMANFLKTALRQEGIILPNGNVDSKKIKDEAQESMKSAVDRFANSLLERKYEMDKGSSRE